MNKDKNNRNRRRSENIMENILMLCAAIFILVIILITIFIFAKGMPLLLKIGIVDFLFNSNWMPGKGSYGIWTMFVGSLAVTFIAMVWAVPLGIITAIFMAEIAPPRVAKILGSMVELLAGIPSVVYGFVGL
ncbi:MAG: phosphate ABC transporter permease subunit PstC, partial [Syntrophomonas sp.]